MQKPGNGGDASPVKEIIAQISGLVKTPDYSSLTRIPNIDELRQELKAWNDSYDKDPSPVNWQFTAQDSRIKLKKLYPDIDKIRKEREERRKAKAGT